jgi:hypothetical protein
MGGQGINVVREGDKVPGMLGVKAGGFQRLTRDAPLMRAIVVIETDDFSFHGLEPPMLAHQCKALMTIRFQVRGAVSLD